MNNDFRRQGWVKLHRKIIQSSIFANPDLLKLWILCLAKANHSCQQVFLDGVSDPIEVMPGQFVTGRFALHREYYPFDAPRNKSPITVWRWLESIAKTGMLNIKPSNKYSLIEIVNWDLYQNEGGEVQQNEQQMNNRRTSNEHQVNNRRTSDEHQMITNKNDKNEENEKNEQNERDPAPTSAVEVSSSFSEEKPDTVEEAVNYFIANGSSEKLGKIFYSNYEGKGWQIGGDKIRKWKAIADKWMLKEQGKNQGETPIDAKGIADDINSIFEDEQNYKRPRTKGDKHADALRNL